MDSRLSKASPFRLQNATESLLRNGFRYSRRLSSHGSCVNALTFSSGDGRFLASGGDDLRIKLWDFHQEDIHSPSWELVGPTSNIFTLEFSAKNRYLYSGGVCQKVFQYDTSTLASSLLSRSPSSIYSSYRDNVRALSGHPYNEEVLLSACDDGSLCRFDTRASNTQKVDSLHFESEMTGVQYHPRMSHLFVTSDGHGNVCLRDERMAFASEPSSKKSQGAVLTFNTKLTRRSSKHLSNPEVSSISLDKEGEKLSVTFLHYLPTIYSISDPNPVAVCSGNFLPDGSPIPTGQRTYTNSCTMKHGHFGNLGSMNSDSFYGAGSDDFRGYVWRLPPVSQLQEQRTEISPEGWSAGDTSDETIAFSQGSSETKYIPMDLSTPFCRLNGHRSIVNTVLFHPQLLHIVTAGIEKDVILHSPTPGSPCTHDLAETPTEVRNFSDRPDEDRLNYWLSLTGELGEGDSDEEGTISTFDHLLRMEGQADVFQSRRWNPDSEDSSSSEDEDEDGDEDPYYSF